MMPKRMDAWDRSESWSLQNGIASPRMGINRATAFTNEFPFCRLVTSARMNMYFKSASLRCCPLKREVHEDIVRPKKFAAGKAIHSPPTSFLLHRWVKSRFVAVNPLLKPKPSTQNAQISADCATKTCCSRCLLSNQLRSCITDAAGSPRQCRTIGFCVRRAVFESPCTTMKRVNTVRNR
jgi:hypothetical protein